MIYRTSRIYASVVTRSIRPYSVSGNFRRMNSAINKIGDENSHQSATALKVVRRTGVATIIIVLCLIFWTSSMSVDVHEPEIHDLTKDVRDAKD